MIKKDKNIWKLPVVMPDLIDTAQQEEFGSILAAGVSDHLQTSTPCLSPEEMAMLLERRGTAAKREEWMGHLAACGTCYETYMLAAELQDSDVPGDMEDTHKGQEPGKKKWLSTRYMALAATVCIAMVSLYIFYKSNEIPKSARQVVAMSDMAVEEKTAPPPAPQPTPGASTAFSLGDDEKKPMETTVPDSLKKEERKAKRSVDKSVLADDGLRGARETEVVKPEPSLKMVAEPKSVDVAATTPPLEKEAKDSKQDSDSVAFSEKAKDRDKKMEAVASKVENKVEGHVVAKKSREEKGSGEKKGGGTVRGYSAKPVQQQPLNVSQNMAVQQELQAPAPAAAGQTGSVVGVQQKSRVSMGVWERIEQLKGLVPSTRPDKNTGELAWVWGETMELAQQLKEQVTVPGVQARVSPFMQVGQSGEVVPDVSYFLSLSQPGSVEFRFFSLALSGWCVKSGACYGRNSLVPDWEKNVEWRRVIRQRWEALMPELTGVFKEIATYTIKRLKE